MSDAKFSSGPWSFDSPCFDQKIPIKGGVTAFGRPYVIAHINRPGSAYASQAEANARLIAAAPELLEALRYTAALAQIATERRTLRGDTLVFTGRFAGMGQKSVNAILDEADAAIAKALGEGQ